MLWISLITAVKSGIPMDIFGSAELNAECPSGRATVTVDSTFSGCSLSGITTSSLQSIIYSKTSITIRVLQSTFINCYSVNASGGVFSLKTATLEVEECKFTSCSARETSYGGVLYQTSTSKLIMTKSRAEKCYAGKGGGVMRIAGGSVTIKDNCVFNNCNAQFSSGGAISDSTSGSGAGVITVSNTKITSCHGKGGSLGGAIWIAGATTTLSNCEINSCQSVYGGGAVYQMNSGSKVTISDCIVKKCLGKCLATACPGGALALEGGSTTITNTIFEECHAKKSGGVIGTQGRNPDRWGKVVIRNCQMIKCTADQYAGAMYFTKGAYSLTIDDLLCDECYGTGTKGLTIYISNISTFSWRNLCIRGTGSLVYSVKNQPSVYDANNGCPITNSFTNNEILNMMSKKRKYVIWHLSGLIVYMML